jgi:hypothetical protein
MAVASLTHYLNIDARNETDELFEKLLGGDKL